MLTAAAVPDVPLCRYSDPSHLIPNDKFKSRGWAGGFPGGGGGGDVGRVGENERTELIFLTQRL